MTDAQQTLAETWRGGWKKADRRPIYEWAADNVKLPAALTKNGAFDVSTSRYLVEPFDALANDRVRTVTIRAPVRSGKTLLADVWLPWIACNDPGPTMVNMQTDKIADEHARLRINPILESAVGHLLPDDRRKVTAEVILKNGMPLYIQGPSISNLQSKGIRYQVNDEIWVWKSGRLYEATGRLGDFEEQQISKQLNISQAGAEGDDFDLAYQRGTQRVWTVQCQSCGEWMPAIWSGTREDGTRWGMRWDEHRTESGDWNVRAALDTIRYECRDCGHPHIRSTRLMNDWNRTGKYVETNPDAARAVESFWWSAVVTRQWTALVEEFLLAMNSRRRGGVEQLITFFQKRMAEPKSEATIIQDSYDAKRIDYQITDKWEDEKIRFLTADRQQEQLYWVTVRAWAEDGRSRRLFFGSVFGPAAIEEVRDRFKVQPNHTFIDSGYQPKGDDGVYADCIRYGWIALKGDEAYWFVHQTSKGQVRRAYSTLTRGDPGAGTAKEGRVGFARLIRFSAPGMKDRVTRLIKQGRWVEPKPGGDETSSDMESEYRQQMAGEYKKVKRDRFTGKETLVWVCPSGNNHAFDCASMQAAAATIAKVLPAFEAEETVDP